MPAFSIESSVVINKNSQEVHRVLGDFKEWLPWSPWLYMEPEAHLDYRGQAGQIGHGYVWTGDLTGAGGMTMTRCDPERLEMDLQFIKPFKSQAKVGFTVREQGADQISVTWDMASSLPFFMFFMVSTMKAMITSDYERGLRLLKDYVETGVIPTKSEVVGIVDVPGQHFIGVTAETSMADIGQFMENSMSTLSEYTQSNDLTPKGPPLTVYDKMMISKQRCVCTVAHSISDAENLPPPIPPIVAGQIQSCRALKVIHKGRYDHLGNAWSTAIANQRAQKLKPSKTQPPFEVYISDPAKTAAEELITEIYVPIR